MLQPAQNFPDEFTAKLVLDRDVDWTASLEELMLAQKKISGRFIRTPDRPRQSPDLGQPSNETALSRAQATGTALGPRQSGLWDYSVLERRIARRDPPRDLIERRDWKATLGEIDELQERGCLLGPDVPEPKDIAYVQCCFHGLVSYETKYRLK
jgi:hypothetical protein